MTLGRDFIDYPYASDLGAVQLAAAVRAVAEVRLLDAFALPGATLTRTAGGGLGLGAPVGRLLEDARAAAPYEVALVALTPFHRPPGRDPALGQLLAGLRTLLGDRPLWLCDAYQSGQHYLEAEPAALLASYPEVDLWVKYEAERTVPALLGALARGEPSPRGWVAGEPADLATLPPPAWDLVDLQARDALLGQVVERSGRAEWPFRIDGRTLPLVTSRGCPYRCVHCSSNPGRPEHAPKTQRRLPPQRVHEHVAALVQRHHATRLFVLDELVNATEAHLDALLDAAEAAAVPFELPNGVRADHLTPSQLGRLARRLTTLSVSAESGVQRVVDEVVHKHLRLSEVERVAQQAKAAGLPLRVHFIIGLPGERPEEINATLEFACRLQDEHGARPAVQYATPLPGTPLAALAQVGSTVPGDFGPRFQVVPSATDALAPPELLRRFRWAFDRRLAARAAPDKLILNLTYRCNNHCVFCAVGNRVRRDGDPSHQRALLESYRARGVRRVDFDGGEPTLHPELLPLIGHAVALGYERIAVTTNGRRCAYPAFARGLMGSGLTTLMVSLHGPDRATHGRHVGSQEAFDQTVAGLRNGVRFAPAGTELGVNVTLTRHNAGTLDALAALVFGLGVRWMNLQFLTPFGRATRELAPDVPAATAEVAALLDRWSDRMRLRVVNLPPCLLPGHEEQVAPDLGKLGRDMVFVNDEAVNLGEYLSARRVRKDVCAPCPYAIGCAGFYELEDAPEPPWTGENSEAPNTAT